MSLVQNWIRNGVNLEDFMVLFSGDYKGQHFDSPSPPSRFFSANFSANVSNRIEETCGRNAVFNDLPPAVP